MSSCAVATRHCRPCDGDTALLSDDESRQLLDGLRGWHLADNKLEKTFVFGNHFETMAFVNAIAWISHREDHHPELTIGYKDCRVIYWTHAIGGLSENDFICAGKLEKLLKL